MFKRNQKGLLRALEVIIKQFLRQLKISMMKSHKEKLSSNHSSDDSSDESDDSSSSEDEENDPII